MAGRPKTRDVVREEIENMIPGLVEQLKAALQPQTAQAPTVARRRQVEAPKRTRGRKVQGVEAEPEGGFADTYEVRCAAGAQEARPKGTPEIILEQNYNVYFYRSGDGESVKPRKATREALMAAGYRYARNFKRWYGPKATLPADFRDGIVG